MKLAVLDDTAVVLNVIEADVSFLSERCINGEKAKIGYKWDGCDFVPAVSAVLPEIVITSIMSDNPDATIIKSGYTDITCPAGSKLTCTAELRAPDGSVIKLDGTFRMPLRSRDGRERLVLVELKQGLATFNFTIQESGLWAINQESINSGLPSDEHMAMKEVLIYVCI